MSICFLWELWVFISATIYTWVRWGLGAIMGYDNCGWLVSTFFFFFLSSLENSLSFIPFTPLVTMYIGTWVGFLIEFITPHLALSLLLGMVTRHNCLVPLGHTWIDNFFLFGKSSVIV